MSAFLEKLNLADAITKIEPIADKVVEVTDQLKEVDNFALKIKDDISE